MKDTTNILNAKYVSPFKIELTFSDQAQRVIDFKPFLEKSKNPEIRKYLHKKLFKSFRILDGDLDWNDFDLCFPIEELYQGHVT